MDELVRFAKHFRKWFACHYGDFSPSVNDQLLSLENEAEAALKDKEIPVETCHFCGEEKEREKAIHEGWIPTFWHNEKSVEVFTPVCPKCRQEKLQWSDGGNDWETK